MSAPTVDVATGIEAAKSRGSSAPKQILDRFWVRALLKTTTVVALVIAWQLYSQNVSPILMPTPHEVWSASIDMIKSGELFSATGNSMKEFAVGFSLGIVLGIAVGILMGRVRLFAVSTEHVFNALYVTPQIAFIPLIMVWFGIGFNAKVTIIFLVSFFPIMLNTSDGVAQISRLHVEVARSYGAKELRLIREVMIPSTLPFIMTGIRLGAGRGLTGMIVAEFFTAVSGLGGLLLRAENTFQTAEMFVPIVVLGIIGMIIIQGGKMLEKRLVRWKESERAF